MEVWANLLRSREPRALELDHYAGSHPLDGKFNGL